MTTDTDRLRFIETAQRLSNWVARTRLPPAEFIRAGSNRALFDDLIKPVAAPLAPKPPKPRRRRPRRWRRWEDLSEAEKDQIVLEMTRRASRGKPRNDADFRLYLCKKSIIADKELPYIDRPRSASSSFLVKWIRSPPTNTPAERLYDRRRAAFNKAIFHFNNNYGSTAFAQPTFIPDCHPDDVELTADLVIVDARLRKLHDLFTEIKQPLSIGISEYPLAASLFLTDAAENVQVYYCALLRAHRSAPPTLELAYIARAFNLSEQSWRISMRFKRASNALQAGMKLYGEGVAAHIHQPAAGEGGSK